MVIIISCEDDAHLSFVTRHLRDQYVVIDAGDIINEKGLTYHLKDSLTTRFDHVQIKDVTGIWLRRPRSFTHDLELNVPPGFERYSKNAINNLLGQLYALYPSAQWVSDRYAIDRAGNKMHQLVLAKELGFNVPETLMTSDPNEAKAFVANLGEVIVKSLSIYSPIPNETSYLAFYAQKVTIDSDISYKGLHVGPCIFQQLIKPEDDIRVTVVGDEVFAAKIIVHGLTPDPSIRDWHIAGGLDNIKVEACEIPKQLADLCRQLVHAMGLTFGAIDLVQDKKGEYWFIEINPNGQWAFVEQEAGLPIGKALATLLETRRP
jgi:hypothetical protein